MEKTSINKHLQHQGKPIACYCVILETCESIFNHITFNNSDNTAYSCSIKTSALLSDNFFISRFCEITHFCSDEIIGVSTNLRKTLIFPDSLLIFQIGKNLQGQRRIKISGKARRWKTSLLRRHC